MDTVTWQDAVRVPAVAVILAVPGPTARTRPVWTSATDSSEEDQLTEGSVAFSGSTVALTIAVSPRLSDREVGATSMEDTSITGFPQDKSVKTNTISMNGKRLNSCVTF
jgi:hypothetical protein